MKENTLCSLGTYNIDHQSRFSTVHVREGNHHRAPLQEINPLRIVLLRPNHGQMAMNFFSFYLKERLVTDARNLFFFRSGFVRSRNKKTTTVPRYYLSLVAGTDNPAL